ncbi:hypothetical protein ACOMHN_028630 [Nucella lapillus]
MFSVLAHSQKAVLGSLCPILTIHNNIPITSRSMTKSPHKRTLRLHESSPEQQLCQRRGEVCAEDLTRGESTHPAMLKEQTGALDGSQKEALDRSQRVDCGTSCQLLSL